MSTRYEVRKTPKEQNIPTFQKEFVQKFQDAYCQTNHLYMVLVEPNMEVVTAFSGTEEEKAFVNEKFPAVLQRELVASFADGDGEDVVALRSEYPYLYLRGVAIRGKHKKLAGIWLVMAVSEPSLDQEMILPQNIMTTTETCIEESIHLLGLISNAYFSKQMGEADAIEQIDEVKSQIFEMNRELQKAEVMADILQNIESDESFEKLATYVLAQTGKYMDLSNCHMLQLEDDDADIKVDLFSEWAEDAASSCSQMYQGLKRSEVPFLTGRPYTISSDSVLPDPFDIYFKKHNIKAGVFLPIEIHKKTSMYLCFMESKKERKWAAEDLQFFTDIKRLLTLLLNKRISQNSLASSYAALDSILEHAGCGICVCDVKNKVLLFSNHSFKQLRLSDEERNQLQWEILNKENVSSRAYEFAARESRLYFELSFSDITWVDGRDVRLATVYDITQIKQYQEKLERQVGEDYLTGLFNRMRFVEDLEHMIHASVRAADSSAMIYMDIQRFGQLNDELGHKVGNEMLKNIALFLSHLEGGGGHCYRVGGDEFAILVTSRYYEQLEQMIATIIRRFEHSWQIEGQEYSCTMNMGVIRIPKDGVTVDTLIHRVDLTLHQAKRLGKNTVEYYGNKKEDGILNERLEMEQNLRLAVANHKSEFVLHYQPIFALPEFVESRVGEYEEPMQQGEAVCIGAEALLRWHSPTQGVLAPEDFLSMAEYLGLMPAIGHMVLLEACKKCKYWHDFGHPEFHVTVNMSENQLLYKDMIAYIKEALEKAELAPEYLRIDVTAYELNHNFNHLAEVLQEIKEIGVQIALDNFGTEHTSFQMMKTLSADIVKFDETCINQLGKSEFMDAYVASAIQVADVLGVKTLAKGVEWKKQVVALQKMHVSMAQGFVFDQALSEDGFDEKYLFS